mmetsp:Transcript_13543/g.20448  ORF Transcript_13543/g.20448 Transcript_13543/m.20448 type:complete len:194 (-) Transcript_13543:222-803(-)
MMLRPLLILSLSFAASPASAFHINASPKKLPATTALMAEQHTTRRVAVQRATSASLGLLTTLVSTAATTIATAEPANADVIRSPGKCANGEGEGCDSLAGDNALIQSLQRKSSENREANQRETINAYYMKNYPDVFAVSDKRMVKKLDGSFALFSAEEVKDLTQAGKITLEYPKSKGGRIMDLTQKPVLVLNE